uniref:DCN1-like protein n=1 Tax=Labrus bergylta TaxID=56723 RepID=A0A3Q3FQY9_9LABR
MEGICSRFPCMLLDAQGEENFKDLYRFTFQFGLDADEGQRSLQRDIAIALWRLVFTQDTPAILERWLDFLAENPSGIRGISRDTWNMFLNFTQAIGPDLSNYSEDEAWPSLFDTFVEWDCSFGSPFLSGGIPACNLVFLVFERALRTVMF